MSYWIIRRDGVPFLSPYFTGDGSDAQYSDRQKDAMRFPTKQIAKDHLKTLKGHTGWPRVVKVTRTTHARGSK